MAKTDSMLRQAFDSLEEPLRKRAEELAASREYGRTLYAALGVWAALARGSRRASTGLLHLVNLPAHADLRRLARQLGALEAKIEGVSLELERLSRRLDERDRPVRGPRKRKSA